MVPDPISSGDTIDFKALVENSVDVICCSGFDRIVRYISPSCFNLLGWKPEELIGKGPEVYILPEDLPMLDTAGDKILAAEDHIDIAMIRMRRKNGSVVWVEINVRLVRDPVTAEPKEYVIVMRDMTERKDLEKKLSTLALTDSLTGLMNRRAFDEALTREWKRAVRYGAQISLLMLDIDHFKRFNDRYGHHAGDDCLRAVAAAVGGAVRVTDSVARYGGEEITVILPSTFSAGATEAAEKVRCAVEALRLSHEGNPEGNGWITVSVGVATALVQRGEAAEGLPEALLEAADSAMYKAKNEGRNRVVRATAIRPARE
ncbi:MAG: sensor domain-containing diguanylate cyclase [Terracidiphilus sp.]|jgi:diguanylate cyclase (GGDEF)-like protein/PAS domain S-box-containing protein